MTALRLVGLMMFIVAGCKSPAPSPVVNGIAERPRQWHGPVKNVTTMGMTEALFDPVESPRVYYKLTATNYAPGLSDAQPILLTQYVGKTIYVTFQKEASGILWGAVIAKQ